MIEFGHMFTESENYLTCQSWASSDFNDCSGYLGQIGAIDTVAIELTERLTTDSLLFL